MNTHPSISIHLPSTPPKQVPELKAMLEMNLHNHATLSTGDLLQV